MSRSKMITVAGAALGATVVFAPAAHGDTFVVDTTDDGDDNDCFNGDCTLREAAFEANGNAGDDVITFASGVSGEIELDSSDGAIDLNSDGVSIQGPGAGVLTVSGEDDSRIFKLFGFDAPDEQVTISGLTLANGFGEVYNPFGSLYIGYGGGALYSGYGVSFDPVYPADVTIADSVLTDNATDSGSSDYGGGAIKALYGDVTITNTQISGNYAYGDGGGIDLDGGGTLTVARSAISGNEALGIGGGIHVDTTPGDTTDVAIADSLLQGNSAADGGGIYLDAVSGGTLIERTTFSGNAANFEGGGVYVDSSVTGPVTIRSATIAGNRSTEPGSGDGGGIGIDNTDSPVAIENTTVSGNSADSEGGGIWIDSDSDDEEDNVSIANSTVTGNSAGDDGGGVFRDADGGAGDEVELSSTIVANNTATDGPDLGDDPDIDSGGDFIAGFSLIRGPGLAQLTETPAGSNIFGVDPQLDPLASNGGPTQTHGPALTSPVLDRGIANGLANDQRGVARTSDLALVPNGAGSDATDIGAVEIQAADVEAQCQATTVRKLSGTEGDDTLTGTGAPEALFGLGGNDSLNGAGGKDCVNGDAGKDRLKGAGGKDQLKGDAGKDALKGGGGKDRLNGGGGKDKLSGGGGKDRLKGGPGKDKIKGGGGKDRINCGGGKDKVTVSAKDKVSRNCEKVVEKG